MNTRSFMPSLLMTALLLAAIAPLSSVAAAPAEASEFYYGVEYDWTSLDSDLTNFTGLDLPEMLGEVMGAADDAGFNLIVGQLLTGSSNVYVHHTEDITPQTIQNLTGDDVSVWSRTDEVTLRHGVLSDGLLMTDWLQAASFGGTDTSFDIDASTTGEQVLTVDMAYTEYLDDDYNLVGADMAFSMSFSIANDISFEALFEGGGEELPIDFDTGISVSYGITESATQWRLGSPSPIYVSMSANDYTSWYCLDEWDLDMGAESGNNAGKVVDLCGVISGTYTGALDYAFSLSGIPTEDIGLDAGELDIELSDSITESGTFEEDIDGTEIEFSLGDDLIVDLGDGAGLTTTVAACGDCPPGNPLMFLMMGEVIGGASESFAESVAEDVADELSDSLMDLFGEGDQNSEDDYDNTENQWQCDSGDQWVYEWEVNDGSEDCYDGSDEADMFGSWSGYSDNITMNADINADLLMFVENGSTFTCNDGTILSWKLVRDYSNDCASNEDEDSGHAEGDMFVCNDGTEILWDQINNYQADCATAEDEGATSHYVVETVLFDDTGTPLSQQQSTLCDANGCDTNMDWFYGSVHFNTQTASPTTYGSHEYCVSGSVKDSSDGTEIMRFTEMCNKMELGPDFGNFWIDNGNMEVAISMDVYDWSKQYDDVTMSVSIVDANNNLVYLDSMAIDGSKDHYGMAGDVSVLEIGEYCAHMNLTQNGQSEPYVSEKDCTMVEEESEPSDRLVAIAEAFMESDLTDVLEQFGLNMEDRLSDVAPTEFPYNDGMWAPMWSNEHAAMVGVGVYAMDENGSYTMAGPVTQGYSDDAPTKVSVRYLTGVPASTAAEAMESASSITDIVDAEDHNLETITEELEAAGIDVSNLTLPQSDTTNGTANGDDSTPPTAEELADDAGLLPFLSPISIVAVIALAGVVAGSRRDEDQEVDE